MKNNHESRMSLTAAYIDSISPTLELVIERLEELGPIENKKMLSDLEQVIGILEGIESALKAFR